ncbi:MAG: DUF1269 domain-containing protein [Anaerolineae bacterium]
MSDTPVQLLIAAFNTPTAAEEVLDQLKAAKKEKLIGIQAARVLVKDEKGKVSSKDVGLTTGKGALAGGVVGAVVGIATGGVGLALGAAGALVGGLIGKSKKEGRFNSYRIEQIADALTPNSSAIIAVIEHKWVADLEAELEEAGADVMTAAIAADIAQQLVEGRNVAFSATATEDSLTTGRIAAGADEIQISSTTFTADAVESVQAVANQAGIAAMRTIETADGVAGEMIAATEEGAVYVAGVVDDAGVDVVALVADAKEAAPALEAGEAEGGAAEADEPKDA